MIVHDIIKDSAFTVLNSPKNTDRNITGSFACDLLSHVMGNALEGQVLITVLNNINVLGVASLLDLPAVIFSHNINVQQPLIDKANELDITLLSTSMTTSETVLTLSKMGL